jgi:hypothetical protein
LKQKNQGGGNQRGVLVPVELKNQGSGNQRGVLIPIEAEKSR